MENNYQLSRIHNYVMGLMSKEEMYAMEKEALEDPFLQDAIDGYRLQQGVDRQQLSILQQRLARKLESKALDKTKRFYSWQRLTIGLAAAVLFMVACSLILFKYLNQQRPNENTEVLLMEQEMRVSTTELTASDAQPVLGMNQFNEELNSELRDYKGPAEVRLKFLVENGKAKSVQIIESTDPELSKVLQGFIQDKITWKGNSGSLWIQVK
ncbi:hypothetical protein GCM10022216_29290 [Sphingobacterium kyonggiense]|uniref:Uncharacterized protein n=1 Tax=Sphingobacterium kyonggiense TaxID=714075 RepID=A0ABP7Z1L4_9SPHI